MKSLKIIIYDNGKKIEEIKMEGNVVVLNGKFEIAKKWIDACYAIYNNEEVELYTEYDTPYPIISAEEIQKLAKLMKKEKPKASIQIFLHLYDEWGVSTLDTEVLEDLEDSIRDLLHGKGFGEFNIEDGYTGNSLAWK